MTYYITGPNASAYPFKITRKDQSPHLTHEVRKRADTIYNWVLRELQTNCPPCVAEQDIKAAATVHIGGEREIFERECDSIGSAALLVVGRCKSLLEPDPSPEVGSSDPVTQSALNATQLPAAVESSDGEWYERIQRDATKTLKRLTLNDGDSAWSFERIFDKGLIAGCTRVALIDPYLAAPHQLRNLKEFLLVVAESSKPKELLVVTSPTWNEGAGANVRIMDEVGNDLFRFYGTNLTISVDPTFHDRYVVFDHGLLFKLGRGLDIYKPAIGLASHRPTSRRVRRTDIDIFAVKEFPKDRCM